MAGLPKALAIRRKILGEEHPDKARSYNNPASICLPCQWLGEALGGRLPEA